MRSPGALAQHPEGYNNFLGEGLALKPLSIVLLGVMGAVLAFDGPAGAQTNNTPADQPPPSADQRPFPANQRPSPAARRAPELQAICRRAGV